MNMSQTASPSADLETASVLRLRTGRKDCCQAQFRPDQYQLVLIRDGEEEKIDLGYAGSRLLERLIREPGEVVSRDELLAHAWSDRVVGQGSLNQQIYTLRQILADEKKREIIQTLPRRGYMFNPQFLNSEEPTANDASAGDDDEPLLPQLPQALRNRNPRRRLVEKMAALAGGMLCLSLVVGADIYHSLFSSPLQSSEQDIGSKHFVYAAPSQEQLSRLREDTDELIRRLANLNEAPARIHLSRSNDFYEVLCNREGQAPHWLLVHREQLASLDETQLRSCLP